MVEVSVEIIRNKAQELVWAGKKWHFHILTPTCLLNKTKKYTLILENTTDKQVWVNYSDNPFMDIGKELVQLLHGNKVAEKSTGREKASPAAIKIAERAKALTEQNIAWHHHMLFPGCQFNKHKNKWTLMLEDPLTKYILESVTETEPKADLQLIEPLFYAQEK